MKAHSRKKFKRSYLCIEKLGCYNVSIGGIAMKFLWGFLAGKPCVGSLGGIALQGLLKTVAMNEEIAL